MTFTEATYVLRIPPDLRMLRAIPRLVGPKTAPAAMIATYYYVDIMYKTMAQSGLESCSTKWLKSAFIE